MGDILSEQYPSTAPTPDATDEATSPLLLPVRAADRLAHFAPEVYDLSPDSSLSRLLKVILGDAGMGQLRKRLLMARLAQTLGGTNFFDLDRFYGALFGMRRRSSEILNIGSQTDVATDQEWLEDHARDASYRTRIEQFGRAVSFGASPTGMELAAEALLNVDVDIYESFGNPNLSPGGSAINTWGEVEEIFGAPGMTLVGLYLADDDPNPRGRISAISPDGTKVALIVTDSDEAWPRFDTITWPARTLIRSTPYLTDINQDVVAIDNGENIYYVRNDGVADMAIVKRFVDGSEVDVFTAPNTDTIRAAIDPTDSSLVVLWWEVVGAEHVFHLLRMNNDGTNVEELHSVPQTGGGPYPTKPDDSTNPVFPGDGSIWFVAGTAAPYDVWRFKDDTLTQIDGDGEGNVSWSLVPQPDGSVLTQFASDGAYTGRRGVRITPGLAIEDNDILDSPFTGPLWAGRSANFGQVITNPFGTSPLDDSVGRYYRIASATTWGSLENFTWGDLEGDSDGGSLPDDSVQGWSFTVRPKRAITIEEQRDVQRVLARLKPAYARMMVDPFGINLHREATIRAVTADSEHWEIRPEEEPHRPPFSGYQGEIWSLNREALGVVGWSESQTGGVIQGSNRTVVRGPKGYIDFLPWMSLLPVQNIDAGRSASDGILVAHPYSRPRTALGGTDPEGSIVSGQTSVQDLSALWIDGHTTSLPRPPLRPQRPSYWATVDRHATDPTREVLEVRYATSHLVNSIAFKAAHYPQTIRVQTFNARTGLWESVALHTIRDSAPRTITNATAKDENHPHHTGRGHWVDVNLRFPQRLTTKVRIIMQRYWGTSIPRTPQGKPARYSLAVRDLNVMYRVSSLADAKAASGQLARDAYGEMRKMTLKRDRAKNLLSDGVWRSEPQPVGNAVVNLYADMSDLDGNPQIVDRWYLDPLYNGAHLTLYHSNDEPSADTPASDTPMGLDVLTIGGTVVPTDQGLSFESVGAYVDVPPTVVGADLTQDWWLGMIFQPQFNSDGVDVRPLFDLGGTNAYLLDGGLEVDWVTNANVNEDSNYLSPYWLANQTMKVAVGYDADAAPPTFRTNSLVPGLASMETETLWEYGPGGDGSFYALSRSDDVAYDGDWSLKFTVTADLGVDSNMVAAPYTDPGAPFWLTDETVEDLLAKGALPVVIGQRISAAASAMAGQDPTNRQISVMIATYDEDGAILNNSGNTYPLTGEMQRYETEQVIVDPAVAYVLPTFMIAPTFGGEILTGEVFYLDAVVLSSNQFADWEGDPHPQARISLYVQVEDGEILSESFLTYMQQHEARDALRIGSFHTEYGMWTEEGTPDFLLNRFVFNRNTISDQAVEDFFSQPDNFTLDDPEVDRTQGALIRFHPLNIDDENTYGILGGPGDIYTDVTWTPIARDYTLQRGFIHLPPTSARWWKFEFTNLSAQAYESFLPIFRTVRLFPNLGKIVPSSSSGQSLPPGLQANKDLNTNSALYRDLVLAATDVQTPEAELVGGARTPTSVLYSQSPERMATLAERNHLMNFVPHQQGISAPRFDQVGKHRYITQVLKHNAKVGFFVGLRELRAYRIDYAADDDTLQYREHFYDGDTIESSTWEQDPNRLYTDASPMPAVATSVALDSHHPVRALQFATLQSDPVQVVRDDEFRDSGLLTTNWANLDEWHVTGEALASYDSSNTTVTIRRTDRTEPVDLGMEQPPFHPVFSVPGLSDEETAVLGGLESELLDISAKGRVHAAIRLRLLTPLTTPLYLQIVNHEGLLLANKPITGRPGDVIEDYLTYVIDSYVAPVQTAESDFNPYRTIVDVPFQPLTDPPLSFAPGGDGAPDATGDDQVRVRIVQYGPSVDAWSVDTLSLFDESIVWEFTADNVNWYPAYGIRNFVNGVLVFPEGQDGTSLRWRVTGYRPNLQVTSLQIRPWYKDRIHLRTAGHHRGPNVSTFDHEPPIEADPEFTLWDKPIPKSWFLAYKPFPELPIDPNQPTNEFSEFTTRSMEEVLGGINDEAVSVDVTERRGFPGDVIPEVIDSSSMVSTFTRSADDDLSGLDDRARGIFIAAEEDPINVTLPATLSGSQNIDPPPLYPEEDLYPSDYLFPNGPDDPDA